MRDLLAPEAVKVVLTDQFVRLGNNKDWPPGSVPIARYLITAATHCAELQKDEREETVELCKKVVRPTRGMTQKNRDRLAAFDDPVVLRRLFDLPNRCFKIADSLFKNNRKVRAAQYHQRGIALAIQFCKPLRRLELVRLHIDEHFKFNDKGEPNSFRIPGVWRGDKTKTGNDVEGYLTPAVRSRLKIHLAKYHPILDKHATGYLFPGKYSGRMNEQSLGNSISQLVEEHLAEDYSIHFVRHLVAAIIFDAGPDNAPLAQRMLDHSNKKITERAYGLLRTRAAHASYTAILEDRLK